MIARSIKGKVLVFSVFVLGIVSGVLATNVWETRVISAPVENDAKPADRAKNADRDVNTFYNYVGMNDAQREQAKNIMDQSKPEFKKLMDQGRALRKETQSQIRSILTDDQKKKYDQFYEEQKKKIDADRNKQRPQH